MNILQAFMDFLPVIGGTLGGAVSQGIMWSIMTLGVYITYKVLDYADLGVDGSFATGGAVTAILITKGIDPFLSLLAAFFVGMLAGLVTGLLHTKLQIPGILAGILTMTALYSVNIRIMEGRSNIPLLGMDTMVTRVTGWIPSLSANTINLIIGVVVTAVVVLLMYWFFGTEIGSAIRATGNNPYMVRALGVSTDNTKIIGLVLSNGLVALSGAMVAQSQGYADVSMGVGTIVMGLASIIIGQVLMGSRFSFLYKLLSVVVGAVLYRVVIAVVLLAGLKSTDLKLFTSIVIAVALALPVIKGARALHKQKQAQRKADKSRKGDERC